MKRLELEIIDYGYDGEGVARRDGKVYFVPKAIVGETVESEMVKEHKKFCECKLSKVIESSPKRVVAPCAYYDQCGGCNYQHVDYNTEIEIKKKLCLKELSKVYKSEEVEFVCGDEKYAYRNKIRFKVKDKKLGFYENKSNKFLSVKRCLIADRKINDKIDLINDFLSTSKHVFEEVVIHSFVNSTIINFLTKDEVSLAGIKNRFDCPVMLNNEGDILECEYFGLKYNFCGNAFRQVNDNVAEKLYNRTLEEIDGKVVLNAFSGAGLLSGLIARKAKKVYGIELNGNAHLGAESLKDKNKINNLTNICGYVEKEIDKIKETLDCVVLDPPRGGCASEVLNFLLQKKSNKLVYISCNVATLVRDLKILLNGYNIEKVVAFDMFPRTANLEIMVVLKAK